LKIEGQNYKIMNLNDAEEFLQQYDKDSKLFFYIQVIVKLFKIDKIEPEKLNTMLSRGTNIDVNYETENKENVLFKVIQAYFHGFMYLFLF
jgi:hypothetical protein